MPQQQFRVRSTSVEGGAEVLIRGASLTPIIEPIAGAYIGGMRIDDGLGGTDASFVSDVDATFAASLNALLRSQNVHVVSQAGSFGMVRTWFWVYRSLADHPGSTLTLGVCSGGHWLPNTTVTQVGTASADVLSLIPPTNLSTLLAYTFASPPTDAGVLAASVPFSLASPGSAVVDVTGLRFFGIRLTNITTVLGGADEGFHALPSAITLT